MHQHCQVTVPLFWPPVVDQATGRGRDRVDRGQLRLLLLLRCTAGEYCVVMPPARPLAHQRISENGWQKGHMIH